MSKSVIKQEGSKCSVAVLAIDIVSDFDFVDGEKLFKNALKIAPKLFQLKTFAREHGIPFIFVNDSYGRWHRDFGNFVETMRASNRKADEILEIVRPDPDDLFLLKPQRSGFYDTDLEYMLKGFNVNRVLIAGVTTDICVLFTAHDAYMRDLKVRVPEDCSAAVEDKHHQDALEFLKRVADVDTTSWIENPSV